MKFCCNIIFHSAGWIHNSDQSLLWGWRTSSHRATTLESPKAEHQPKTTGVNRVVSFIRRVLHTSYCAVLVYLNIYGLERKYRPCLRVCRRAKENCRLAPCQPYNRRQLTRQCKIFKTALFYPMLYKASSHLIFLWTGWTDAATASNLCRSHRNMHPATGPRWHRRKRAESGELFEDNAWNKIRFF